MDRVAAPVAARLRRPGWRDPRLVAGVALIAIAVTGVVVLVRDADRTAPYYAARVALTPGMAIDADDLVVVHARIGDGYLEAPDGVPDGAVASRTVAAGELVPASAIAPAEAFDGRRVAVEVTTALADTVEAGSVVDVWVTPAAEAGRSSLRAAEAVPVAQVDRDSGSFGPGGATVYVVVGAAEVGPLLDALAGADGVTVVGAG